jgi:iron(III) transport system substrate-binding protein
MNCSKLTVIFTTLALIAVPAWAGVSKEASAQKSGGELFVYSVVNEAETQALAALFEEQTGIKVTYLRAATGELIARVRAEKSAPQADVLLGGAESLHIAAMRDGALEPYKSPGRAGLPEWAFDKDGAWTGFCVLTLGIGINAARFAEKFPGKPYPASWDDLADPAFKGELVFTDPVKSQTGYLFLQSQLQGRGAEAGWSYFKKLTPLAAQLPSSGDAPPQLVGRGEYAVCVAYVHLLRLYSSQGFPVEIVIPPKTVGEIDAVSIIKGGPNAKTGAAQKFVDFMLTKEAQELFASISRTIPVNPAAQGDTSGAQEAPLDLLDFDSEKAGAERDAVLLRWEKEMR